MTNQKEAKKIDDIVDKFVEDPAKAKKLKDALHPDVEPVEDKAGENGDDLWDNLPV